MNEQKVPHSSILSDNKYLGRLVVRPHFSIQNFRGPLLPLKAENPSYGILDVPVTNWKKINHEYKMGSILNIFHSCLKFSIFYPPEALLEKEQKFPHFGKISYISLLGLMEDPKCKISYLYFQIQRNNHLIFHQTLSQFVEISQTHLSLCHHMIV